MQQNMLIENIELYLNEFKTIFWKAKKMSSLLDGLQTPSYRNYFASVIFSRVVIQSDSILKILSFLENQHLYRSNFYLDIPSCASILRNIVEAYRFFYYIAIDDIEEDEIKLRHLKFKFKSAVDKKYITSNLQQSRLLSKSDNSDNNQLDREIQTIKEEIQKNSIYQQLEKKSRTHFLMKKMLCL